jgi:hypothetical protein
MPALVLGGVPGVLVTDHTWPILTALSLSSTVAGVGVEFSVSLLVSSMLPFFLVNLPFLIIPFGFGVFFEKAEFADRFSHGFVMLKTFRADIETVFKGAVAGSAYDPAHRGLKVEIQFL